VSEYGNAFRIIEQTFGEIAQAAQPGLANFADDGGFGDTCADDGDEFGKRTSEAEERHVQKAQPRPTMDGEQQALYFFAYNERVWGSVPGAVGAACPAVLFGHHRSCCVHSHVWRGTPEQPGLVLGLVPGGRCQGMLYKVEPNAAADEPTKSLAWLQRKEAPTGVFKEVYSRSVYTMDGKVEAGGAGALIFVVDESHPQYAAGLTESEQADMVAAASGRRGSNHDFLEEFNVNLQASGVRDKELQNLAVAVRRRMHSRE